MSIKDLPPYWQNPDYSGTDDQRIRAWLENPPDEELASRYVMEKAAQISGAWSEGERERRSKWTQTQVETLCVDDRWCLTKSRRIS